MNREITESDYIDDKGRVAKWTLQEDIEKRIFDDLYIQKLKITKDIIFDKTKFNNITINEVIAKSNSPLVFKDCLFNGQFTLKKLQKFPK